MINKERIYCSSEVTTQSFSRFGMRIFLQFNATAKKAT